jgi:type VII secretion protein EccB
MPAQLTTRAQVNGYRFLIRRLQHALIRGDSRMIHDPMRGQIRAMMAGMVVAVLVAGAAGVLAFFKPTPNFGNSSVMLSKTDGALFVRIGDRLHPVLNLASARLITGKPDSPAQVDEKFLDTVARGPVVGILGAPNGIHRGDDMQSSSWTVCDSAENPQSMDGTSAGTLDTTVLANDPMLGGAVRAASSDEAVLASADGRATFLIYGGVRAAVDPNDRVLFRALRLGNAELRTVSPSLLNAFPLVEPIVPIEIDGQGAPTGFLPSEYRVGSLLRVTDSTGQQLFVVLPNGVQAVSAAAADILRYGSPPSALAAQPIDVSPAVLDTVPVVHDLPVDHYPIAAPRFVSTGGVLCMAWQRDNAASAPGTRMLVGTQLPLPASARPVHLATADGSGPGLDNVYVTPGTGEYVQVAGRGPGAPTGQLFYVSDLGLRFHIADAATAAALGVSGVKSGTGSTDVAQAAPWSVVGLLPPGPELSKPAALIAHDGIDADPNGGVLSTGN